jgi:Holliday junction resolvase-like predicted endonuclease
LRSQPNLAIYPESARSDADWDALAAVTAITLQNKQKIIKAASYICKSTSTFSYACLSRFDVAISPSKDRIKFFVAYLYRQKLCGVD